MTLLVGFLLFPYNELNEAEGKSQRQSMGEPCGHACVPFSDLTNQSYLCSSNLILLQYEEALYRYRR